MTDEKCTCPHCGNDLYGEANILLETRACMDKLVDNMETKCVGRPLFVMVVGDNGTDLAPSDTLVCDEEEIDNIILMYLQELVRAYKKKTVRKTKDTISIR